MYEDKRNWKIENEKYVKRGEIVLDFDFVDTWKQEINEMNKNKWGGKYKYPESFIRALAFVYVLFSLAYRQLEGFFRAISRFIPNIEVPDHSTIHRRITKLGIDIEKSIIESKEPITIAIDATGIKVAKRGDWIKNTGKIRKGWLKIHFAVNIKTKQIVSLEVSDEKVGEIEKFEPLVSNTMKYRKVEKVLADTGYDSNENYKYLESKNIVAGIKPQRKRGRLRSGKKSNKERYRVVNEYLNNKKSWKERLRYGMRWSCESAFSAFKRIFGEHVAAKKFPYMVKEMQLKVFALNYLIMHA